MADQDPLTTLLAQEDIYGLPLEAKRGLAMIGGERRGELTDLPVEVGSLPQGTIANTGLGGTITINPEEIQNYRDPQWVADLIEHELEHRRQTTQKGKLGSALNRIRENLLQTLGMEPYGTGPMESGAFRAQARRAKKTGRNYSPNVPPDIMREVLLEKMR